MNYMVLAEVILAIFIIIAPITALTILIVNVLMRWLDGRGNL